jgi:3-dehydroquinate synthase
LNRDKDVLLYVITKSCEIKSKIIEKDFKENNERQFLNFGHTIGHAIENSLGYGKISHGEAISLGMIFELDLSIHLNYLNPNIKKRTIDLLEKCNLPIHKKLNRQKILNSIIYDKKNKGKKIAFICLKKIGEPIIYYENPNSIIITNILQNLQPTSWIQLLHIIKSILFDLYPQ